MIGRRPYRKRKSYTLTVFVVLLAVLLSFSAVRGLFGVRTVLSAVIYPFQFVAVSIWKGAVGAPGALMNLRSLSRDNEELKCENSQLISRLAVMDELINENARLRDALLFKNQSRYRYNLVPAEIIGKSPTPWFSILIINRGSSHGIAVNKPVISREGLVGRVIEVAPFSSKVMLLTDPESTVAAADMRSRDFGVVVGGPRNRLSMRYVSSGKDIKAGDEVITSHISTVFPQGIPIGKVIHALRGEHDLFYNIDIEPAVDFSRLENVFVIR